MVQMDYETAGAVEAVGDALGIAQRRVKGDLERFKQLSSPAARPTAPGAARSPRTPPPRFRGVPGALYETDGAGRFLPTELTRGPWNREHQHAGPPAALLARAVEEASTIAAGQTARLAFDILAPVPLAPLTLETRTLRGGRRIEQIEATLKNAEDKALMRATAWRMRLVETPEVATADPPPPPPSEAISGK